MKKVLISFFILLTGKLFCQSPDQIGQLKLSDCKIVKTENVMDTISGQPIKMARLTITAMTKIQMSCNYGHPSKNEFKTTKNKVAISYAFDSTGLVLDSIYSAIHKYVEIQETWAEKYNSGNDFSALPFYKSFFLKDSVATPFIWTGAENPGDYKLFYVNKQVYKIQLLERNGLGCLSSFVAQNMYFSKGNQRLNLGEYQKNTDKIRDILSRKTEH